MCAQGNARAMTNVTREEAVQHLQTVATNDDVDMTVQYRRDEFDRVNAQNLGDNFYIRSVGC